LSWGWTVIEESDFAVLYDSPNYWIVEDKTTRNLPVTFTGETKTLKNMTVDFSEDEKGNRIFVRAYFPKGQIEYRLARRAFERLTQDRRREFQRLKRLMSAMEVR